MAMAKFVEYIFLSLLLTALCASCNKDDVIISGQASLPVITLDSEYGVYTVKVGHELTIAPQFENVESGSDVTWAIDGQTVGHGMTWSQRWDIVGEYYVDIIAVNRSGSAKEEIRVDVVDLTPPVISLNIPESGFQVEAGAELRLEPYISSSDDCGELAVMWSIDGSKAGEGPSFTLRKDTPGIYKIMIEASNDDGTSALEFDVTVTDGPPYAVSFPRQSYEQQSTTRYTFAGRKVFLSPIIEHFSSPAFKWTVNGQVLDAHGETLPFQADHSGEYQIEVTVSEGAGEDAPSRTAKVTVVCVNATEASRFRPATGASSPMADRVYEYTPAPGQFIGDNNGDITSPEQACVWAERFFKTGSAVSLGSFGGYIVVGFDHSVSASGLEYDLAIGGNAFTNADGTASNEPGIVWVMQDVNGNGLPDDEWYELKACEYDNPQSSRNYSVTYYRPGGAGLQVDWTDSDGNTGYIDYLPQFHDQPSYFPNWIKASSYTLRGSRVPARNSYEASIGKWVNHHYDWGYADNLGSDNIGRMIFAGSPQAVGFKLSNAVYADGSPIALEYFDFVKVQVAVLAKSGALGEVSTEVCGFADYSMTK